MSCAACSARVERSVSSLDGVEVCSVNLLTNSMTVEGSVAPDIVIEAVKHAGYGARISTAKTTNADCADKQKKEHNDIILRLITSALILLPLMYISMGHVMLSAPLPKYISHAPMSVAITEAILSGVILLLNRRFFISGVRAALHRAPNMDTLVSLGSGVSYVYSVILLFSVNSHEDLHGLYFESAAMILVLITLGKLLESYSKGKSTNAIKELLRLSPKTAIVQRNGKEEILPVDEVAVDDVLVLRAGDTVPVDAVVLEGEGAFDESSLTGESVPQEKTVGDTLYTATVNTNGYILCRAEKVGEDTTLASIIKTVSDAAASKAPIAKIADKVSGIFVPIVLGIALLTAAIWMISGAQTGHALTRGISVLVISCPCALGLATPVAIMVSSGKGAGAGILYKSAAALEQTGKTKIVALDKTGTLTYGRPKVTEVHVCEGTSRQRLLSVALSLEQKSEHPLARAIVEYASENSVSPCSSEKIEILSGSGIKGTVESKASYGGNARYISSITEIPDDIKATADELSKNGKTPLFFADEDGLLGLISVSDEPREDSAEAIQLLSDMGINSVMLTGDNALTAQAIADKLGIKRVLSGILPNEKATAIRELQKEGSVLMVGDGINDAPALTVADVGMAIGAGTQIAIESADVVLMHSSPTDIAKAIKLSRHTLRNIKENLFWAFFYNAVGIPLAAGVFSSTLGWELSPMFGALAMSMSSLCVVSNALRLNLVSLYDKKKQEKTDAVITLYIDGMMCSHCEAAVTKVLGSFDGITVTEISHENGTAKITSTGKLPYDDIKEALAKEDYELTKMK